MKLIKDIENELEQFSQTKRQVENSILSKLKNECNTYKELEDKLKDCKRQLFYYKEKEREYAEVFVEIEKVIEKEKSNLQITNHS